MPTSKIDQEFSALSDEQNRTVEKTVQLVKEKLGEDTSGHDYYHIMRVRALAVRLAGQEGADVFVVELAALLHDIADWKFHGGDLNEGPRVASEWLESIGEKPETIEKVAAIIKEVSYKGAGVKTTPQSIEGKVVQDADRLDALGAIGIARTFAYGGKFERPLYDPEQPPVMHQTFEEYKNAKGTTLNHFYEKILLLKDRLNTDSARSLADERHKYVADFVERFLLEWEGKI
ncbi:MAG: HD domain-containing protein [Candidatus Obscuribacterales bacterium]|nr:HD domain-containing protein [Candidatus Obscuribacterales bacterium]